MDRWMGGLRGKLKGKSKSLSSCLSINQYLLVESGILGVLVLIILRRGERGNMVVLHFHLVLHSTIN